MFTIEAGWNTYSCPDPPVRVFHIHPILSFLIPDSGFNSISKLKLNSEFLGPG